MRIGHFVSVVSRLRGYERNVSGHIQVPLHIMQLLADRGHEVHLITNAFGPDRVLPWCMPEPVTVHFVDDSRRRKGSLEKKRAPASTSGVYPLAFFRQVSQMKRIVHENKLDILHLHGHSRSIQLGGVLKLLGMKCPTVASLIAPPAVNGAFSRYLLRRAGMVVTGTEFTADQCRRLGVDATVIRHGVVRDFRQELPEGHVAQRTRVLFWRDLTRNNGADLCLKAFDQLAPEFPDVTFTIAVRPQPCEIDGGADVVVNRHGNVEMYRFPYPEGVSLAQLIAESICVVLPFRKLSVHPQLSIAESLAVGVPVVTSNIGSNGELVHDGRNGRLVPAGDAEAVTAALHDMLSNREQSRAMAESAADLFSQTWSWDGFAEALEVVYDRAIS